MDCQIVFLPREPDIIEELNKYYSVTITSLNKYHIVSLNIDRKIYKNI